MQASVKNIAVLLVVTVLGAFGASHANAQNNGLTGTDTTKAASTTKAQKKAARKQARAKRNAELKKLEDAGYNPGTSNDIDYPQNIQDAQKKANSGAGTSQ
ncbi:hypothetical protein AWB74_05786 [Caballeronia arvi]|uniref:Purine nucleoside phosphorylase n=1 Tax=Caballeronia arvi TaxID=1777135 RepID=A0A158KI61_9BURK|nr:DUF4148 domain-containing protein [Caballeronia arvi]SAL80777.1 hypothetical protein AWB74_05786 [Caballeronia arvi]